MSAFPTAGALHRFTATHFPAAVADLGLTNLRVEAFELVEWALAENSYSELLEALRRDAGDNPRVRALDGAPPAPEPGLCAALARIPPGPRVPIERIDDRIIDALACAGHTRARSHLFILAASRLRRSLDPEVPVVRLYDLPNFDAAGPRDFWFNAVANTCLHGPQMLASLLLVHRPLLREVDPAVTALLAQLERGSYRDHEEVKHA